MPKCRNIKIVIFRKHFSHSLKIWFNVSLLEFWPILIFCLVFGRKMCSENSFFSIFLQFLMHFWSHLVQTLLSWWNQWVKRNPRHYLLVFGSVSKRQLANIGWNQQKFKKLCCLSQISVPQIKSDHPDIDQSRFTECRI